MAVVKQKINGAAEQGYPDDIQMSRVKSFLDYQGAPEVNQATGFIQSQPGKDADDKTQGQNIEN
jgi:hypothetical protein